MADEAAKTAVADLVIDPGPVRGELAAARPWLEERWTLEDLHDPARQAQASAALTQRVPGLGSLFTQVRDTVARAGAAVLRGVPTESDMMLVTISSWLGAVQVIRPGLPLVDNLRPAAGAAEVTRNADSRHQLSPHTDSSILAGAQDFILILGCVGNSDPAGGGESILVFVDEVAHELRRRGHSGALTLLQDHVFPNLNVPADAGQVPVTTAVLGRRPDGALVTRFRDEALRAGLASPEAEVMPTPLHRRALREFTAAVLSPSAQRRIRLTEGDMLMVDNGRVMHGRSAISYGVRRHLKRTFAKRAPSGRRGTA
jgi:hypothetical protein